MNKTYVTHDEFLKDWCKKPGSKEIQCKVFKFLVDWIIKKDDGKYAEVMRELPSIKLKDLDKGEVTYAINNLIRIGYLYEHQRSRGYNIRISKKGWQKWEARG